MASAQPVTIPKGSLWNDARLVKLLMLAFGDIKPNYTKLADLWAKRYRKNLHDHRSAISLTSCSGRGLQANGESNSAEDSRSKEIQ
jgi:hypothetical protein